MGVAQGQRRTGSGKVLLEKTQIEEKTYRDGLTTSLEKSKVAYGGRHYIDSDAGAFQIWREQEKSGAPMMVADDEPFQPLPVNEGYLHSATLKLIAFCKFLPLTVIRVASECLNEEYAF